MSWSLDLVRNTETEGLGYRFFLSHGVSRCPPGLLDAPSGHFTLSSVVFERLLRALAGFYQDNAGAALRNCKRRGDDHFMQPVVAILRRGGKSGEPEPGNLLPALVMRNASDGVT